jgi:glucose uptake protein
MYIVDSYSTAVILTIVTMLCWGSWANSQKIASKNWRFELFYWDYVIGLILFSVLLGFTLGNSGEKGMGFIESIKQADMARILSPVLGGIIFNLSNILLVAAIAIAGMSIAFPLGVGMAMVLGVLINYIATPKGNAVLLFTGVIIVTIAIVIDALAYRRQATSEKKTPAKGIVLSILGGFLMAWFFRFVASSISLNLENPEPGMLTPYSAFFFFVIGIFISNFVFNTYLMKRPIEGEPVTFNQYFSGDFKSHLSGIIGGIVWAIGTSLSFIAGDKAGYAISYGLGQGATMIGAFWGVFIWKEFKNASKGTNRMLALMFLLFITGLGIIIYAGS